MTKLTNQKIAIRYGRTYGPLLIEKLRFLNANDIFYFWFLLYFKVCDISFLFYLKLQENQLRMCKYYAKSKSKQERVHWCLI